MRHHSILSLVLLTACMPDIPGHPVDGSDDELIDTTQISLEDAHNLVLELGVSETNLIYADMLPLIMSDDEAMATWGFIERSTTDYLVTYIDQQSGDTLGYQLPAGDNILDFIEQTGLDQPDIVFGSSSGSYDSFPWSWRLPQESSSGVSYMTYGYGCGYHTGLDAYATDWDPGSAGHLIESPASCWVQSTAYSSSYGNQVIAECGDAGSGKRYGYRIAHMQSSPLVSAGSWIGKGRNIGYMGKTGWATSDHIHYVVYRGSISGSSVSGESLPIESWPDAYQSICGSALAVYDFNTCATLSIGSTGTNGCP